MNTIEYNFKIAGSQYYYQATKIEPNDTLIIKADLLNLFDIDAVEIIHDRNRVGYVPRMLLKKINALIDQNYSLTGVCTRWVSQFEIHIKITATAQKNIGE